MNLKGVTAGTWIRLIVLVLVLINQVTVSIFGNQLLPFSDEQLYEGVSTAFTIVVTIWTTWKNNSLTRKAQQADQIIKK